MSRKYFDIGIGKLDITPPLSIPYLGYYPKRHDFFAGIHDNLYVRSVFITDGKEKINIIGTDTFGFANDILGKDKNFTQEVRKRIKEQTGIPEDCIMLTGSHIHSTPDTLNIRTLKDVPASIFWLENIIEKIASATKLAMQNTFKANLKIGKGEVKNISCNRRGEQFLDNEVIVFLFESLDREKNILMVNFACHPVIVQVQKLISADFVGVVENTVENVLKGVEGCVFLQGACADINPAVGNTCNFHDVYSTGITLAGEVMKVYGYMVMNDYPLQPVIVRAISKNCLFPSRPLPDIKNVKNVHAQLKKKLRETKSEKEKGSIISMLKMKEEELQRLKEGNKKFQGEIQIFNIGNTLLVGIPGEVFCQMGLQIKKECEPMIGVPVGYANGYLGYIAPPQAWEKGGYEVSCGPWSKVGPDAFDKIMETIKSMIMLIKKERNGKIK